MRITINSLEELKKFALLCIEDIEVNTVFALKGDLGAGKTTLARYIIEVLGGDRDEVASPTFTLINEYNTSNGKVYHFDLYRLKSEDEAIDIGLLDYMNSSICIIEWPEIIADFLPNTTRYVNIICNDSKREIYYIK